MFDLKYHPKKPPPDLPTFSINALLANRYREMVNHFFLKNK